MIVIPRLKLGYQFVPKIATTSLLGWLYGCCEGDDDVPRDGGKQVNWKRRYFFSGRFGPFAVENRADSVEPYRDYYRFALTRDPIERFVSMYRNRVVHHRDLSAEADCNAELRAAELEFDPSINHLIRQLDKYLACSENVLFHARPMMDFLGPDLSVYERLADISETDSVVRDIRRFWKVSGIDPRQQSAATQGRLPIEQTGGPLVGLDSIEADAFERLLEFYSEDYSQIPTVDLSGIKQRYLRARNSVSRASVNQTRRLKLTVAASAVDERLVSYALVDTRPTSLNDGELFGIEGVVVMAPQSPANCWISLYKGDRHETVLWGMRSPKMAQRFPDSPNGHMARFRVMNLTANSGEEFRLCLSVEAQSEVELFRFLLDPCF